MENCWYLADLITEFIVAEKQGCVVHADLILVQAASADNAYDRAIELGRNRERTFTNTDGEEVAVRFRGLRNLTLIGDLAHGVELAYQEFDELDENEIVELVSSRENLGVFCGTADQSAPES